MKTMQDRRVISITISAERVLQILQDAGLLHFDSASVPADLRLSRLPPDSRILRVDVERDLEPSLVFHCESDALPKGYRYLGHALRVNVPDRLELGQEASPITSPLRPPMSERGQKAVARLAGLIEKAEANGFHWSVIQGVEGVEHVAFGAEPLEETQRRARPRVVFSFPAC